MDFIFSLENSCPFLIFLTTYKDLLPFSEIDSAFVGPNAGFPIIELIFYFLQQASLIH